MVKLTIELDGEAPLILQGDELKIEPVGGNLTLLTLRHGLRDDGPCVVEQIPLDMSEFEPRRVARGEG